jgi:hypothetical protein
MSENIAGKNTSKIKTIDIIKLNIMNCEGTNHWHVDHLGMVRFHAQRRQVRHDERDGWLLDLQNGHASGIPGEDRIEQSKKSSHELGFWHLQQGLGIILVWKDIEGRSRFAHLSA